MADRKKFQKDMLIKALDEIAKQLNISIEAFLIGGLSMIFHGAKLATKDIDIVFSNQNDAQAFIETAQRIGFQEVGNLQDEYRDLEARCVLEGEEGIRFDVFVVKVCDALTFSEGMKRRAQNKYDIERFKLYVASLEDIFLFKAITNRPADLADMATMAGKEIQWNIIKDEVRAQPEYWKWIGRLYLRLMELEEMYGIPSPLKTELKDEAEIAQAIGVILMRWESGSFSFDDTKKALEEEDSEFVRKVLNEMNRLKIIEEKNNHYYLR